MGGSCHNDFKVAVIKLLQLRVLFRIHWPGDANHSCESRHQILAISLWQDALVRHFLVHTLSNTAVSAVSAHNNVTDVGGPISAVNCHPIVLLVNLDNLLAQ